MKDDVLLPWVLFKTRADSSPIASAFSRKIGVGFSQAFLLSAIAFENMQLFRDTPERS
jgi:hypothetical protein